MRRKSLPPFVGNYAEEKSRLEQQASALPPGPERDLLIRKLRQLNVANHMSDWIESPGLKPPE
jgi:hypothetical protein